MNNLRPFQIILLGVFGLFGIIGIIFFGLYRGSEDLPPYAGGVTIWGTLDQRTFRDALNELTLENLDQVRYIEKNEESFNLELLNAIAEGVAPDLIVLSSDAIVTHRAKLFSIPYESFPERTYRERYVDGAEIFLFADGIYGVPFAVDPLIMYWNRDMLSGSGLAQPPKTWESLLGDTVSALTRVGSNFAISRSAIAFGEYANVENAKSILSLLFLQSGTTIAEEAVDGSYEITLGKRGQEGLPPADAALSFYTQFALPTSASYSWNRTFASDRSAFTGGVLGLYFGHGSEYRDIERANPNLNFDIAQVPQGATATTLRGFGTFYAFAVPRAAQNPEGAYALMQLLGSEAVGPNIANALSLAPVHRSTIAQGTTEVNAQVLYKAALIARAWLDPNAAGSASAFQTMVEDVTSGRSRVRDAVEDVIARLRLLF